MLLINRHNFHNFVTVLVQNFTIYFSNVFNIVFVYYVNLFSLTIFSIQLTWTKLVCRGLDLKLREKVLPKCVLLSEFVFVNIEIISIITVIPVYSSCVYQ